MKVIGTAGHIDHGKSTLVRSLTGIDPDRLDEEKRRGMTIDLGFAWFTLPSGEDVSIVDVPGHERFVKNMLAGVGGIDVALLVVAADESVMPQTREHLDILDLLSVSSAVVALTKRDLVDEEWTELARSDVEDVLDDTALAGSEIIAVSALTGAGMDDLVAALERAVNAAPSRADAGLPYVPVDRAFTVDGFGTVVTGTLTDGTLHSGEEVEIVPGGQRVRIRALQSHRRQVDTAGPGSRVAINLAGVDRERVSRGDVVAPVGTVRAVHRFDGRLRVVADAPFALAHGTEVTVHIGSAERHGTVAVLSASQLNPGDSGWVQMRLDSSVPAVIGQRFIVRLPAPARTIAGGEVADLTPRHRRSDPSAMARLDDILSGVPERRVAAALRGTRVRTSIDLASSLRMDVLDVRRVLERLTSTGRAARVGDGYLDGDAWAALIAACGDALDRYHTAFPLKRGMPKEELRAKLRRPQSAWSILLRALVDADVLREETTVVARPNHRGGASVRREEADRVLSALRKDPFAPPSGGELLRSALTDTSVLTALVEEGEIVHVGEGIYFSADAFRHLLTEALRIIDAEGEVTVAQIRDTAGTSRKYALAFLEHLDSQRITRRSGDARIRGSKAPACA